MRYCGTCGTLLEAGDLAAGRCPACGVPVLAADSSSGGDATPDDAPSVVEYFARGVETPQSLQAPAARADTPTILSGMPLPPPSTPSNPSTPAAPSTPVAPRPAAAVNPPRWLDTGGASARTDDHAERRGASGALAALAVALAALALVVAALGLLGALERLGPVSVLLRNDAPPANTAPALSAATTTSASASPSVQPGPRSTASATAASAPAVTSSPAPTGSPTATGAPPSPTGTPVPTNAPPMLAVDRMSISVPLTQCLLGQGVTSFTVKNSGGGTLDWTATTANGYTISPSSGTLGAGEQASVTISGISKRSEE